MTAHQQQRAHRHHHRHHHHHHHRRHHHHHHHHHRHHHHHHHQQTIMLINIGNIVRPATCSCTTVTVPIAVVNAASTAAVAPMPSLASMLNSGLRDSKAKLQCRHLIVHRCLQPSKTSYPKLTAEACGLSVPGSGEERRQESAAYICYEKLLESPPYVAWSSSPGLHSVAVVAAQQGYRRTHTHTHTHTHTPAHAIGCTAKTPKMKPKP